MSIQEQTLKEAFGELAKEHDVEVVGWGKPIILVGEQDNMIAFWEAYQELLTGRGTA